jgi:putative zinc finger protein
VKDLLPSYAAGTLGDTDRELVRAHLADCPSCRADLAAWRAIADAVASPPESPPTVVRAVLTRSALEGPVARDRHPIRRLAALVVAEARLIRRPVPIASALVMALGFALISVQASAADLTLSLIAPIVAAAGVAGTYRSDKDELIAATPASGRLLLLVRLALVFGYDLALALTASAALAATGTAGTTSLDALVGTWLGPMALLSSLSLLIAVRLGPDVALGAAVGLWAVRVLAGGVLAHDGWPARLVLHAWTTSVPVLIASAAIAVVAIAVRGEPGKGWRATHPM